MSGNFQIQNYKEVLINISANEIKNFGDLFLLRIYETKIAKRIDTKNCFLLAQRRKLFWDKIYLNQFNKIQILLKIILIIYGATTKDLHLGHTQQSKTVSR